jgi:hypothetical protein
VLVLGTVVQHGMAGTALDSLDGWRGQGDVGDAWLIVLANDVLPHADIDWSLTKLTPLVTRFMATAEACMTSEAFWEGEAGQEGDCLRRRLQAWLRLWLSLDPRLYVMDGSWQRTRQGA